MKKTLSLICVICLFISIFQVNAFAAETVGTKLFGLTISSDGDYAGFGDAVNDTAKATYPEDVKYRPTYGTYNDVPYARFGILRDGTGTGGDGNLKYSATNTERWASIPVLGSVDAPIDDSTTTDVHETIADKKLVIEMWIRPYGNNMYDVNVISGRVRGSIMTLFDSVLGTTAAFEVGVQGDDATYGPWKVGLDGDNVTSSSVIIPTVKDGGVENFAAIAPNDGQWNHVVISRYYSSGGGGWCSRICLNGKYLGQGTTGGKTATFNTVKSDDTYLNFNTLKLGVGKYNAQCFRGDIAELNIYEGNGSSKDGIVSIASELYAKSELKSKLQSKKTGTYLTALEGETEITKAGAATLKPTNADVTATIPDFLECDIVGALATNGTNKNDITTVVDKAIAVGYDDEGNIICTQELTVGIDNSVHGTTATGTLSAPDGKYLSDIKVFFWDEDLRPYASVACLQ